MKLLQIIREEVVPLSRRQGIIILVIIACLFQFVLFYAPALADESVKEAQAAQQDEDFIVTNEVMIKDFHALLTTATTTPTSTPKNIKKVDISTIIFDDQEVKATSTAPAHKIVRTSTHTMTAYNSEVGQTDDSPCITANGFNVCKHGKEDTIAANFLKFGTKVMIPELYGDRVFIVRDRMNKKHPNRVDIWMKDHGDAIKFGVKVAKIQVIE